MAENFAALEYKTQEEVLTVLKYLTAVLSTTGMQLVEMLSPQHLLAQLHEPMSQAQPGDPPMMASQNDQAAFTAESSATAEAVASQSAIVTGLSLRQHSVAAYFTNRAQYRWRRNSRSCERRSSSQ